MKKFFTFLLAVSLLAVPSLAVRANALSFEYEIGEEVYVVIAGSKGSEDPISRLYDVQGLPIGLSLRIVNGWQIALQGTAKQSGTFPFTYSFVTSGKEEHINVSDTVVINAPPVEITKCPSSETVTEHSSALFSASAVNYSSVDWKIVDGDDNVYTGPEEMMALFPDLTVETFLGDNGKEYLQLKNIPLEMNHYLIIAEFHNLDYSDSVSTPYMDCAVFVQEKRVASPVINTQPVGAELDMGTVIRLEIQADCAEGELSYQWYRNLVESSENGIALSGENAEKYVPDKTPGTVYYYCAVWASSEGKNSDTVYSDIVAVTYIDENQDEKLTSPAGKETEKSDESVSSQENADETDTKTGVIQSKLMQMERTQLIALIGIVALVLVSGAVLIALNRRENR